MSKGIGAMWSSMPGWAKVAALGAAFWAAREVAGAMSERKLGGQLVVLTGAGSGIGRLMALKLAREGAQLALWDVNAEGVKKVAGECTELGARASAYIVDVTDRARVYEAAAIVRTDFGADVDMLINNAGIVSGKKLLENSDNMIEKTFQVNTISHFWTVKAFLPAMIKRNHGHIVTICSASAFVGVAGLCDYSASKWAAFGFDESLRFELQKNGNTGVRTTCVCPFFINTGMFEGVTSRLGPLMPILEPDYVASMIIRSVKRGDTLLCMPRLTYFSYLFRGVLPSSVWDAACTIMGINSSMDEFVGRSGSHGGAGGK